MAVDDVIASKTFDNGTICSSDQSVIFDDKATADKALKLFEQKGAYMCTEAEKAKLEQVMFDKERGVPSMAIVGKSPQVIGALAGLKIPEDRKLLMVPLTTTGGEDWMSHEKLSPVLGWYRRRQQGRGDQRSCGSAGVRRRGPLGRGVHRGREGCRGVCAEGACQPRDVEPAFGPRHDRRTVQHAGSVADPGLRRTRRQHHQRKRWLQEPAQHQETGPQKGISGSGSRHKPRGGHE